MRSTTFLLTIFVFATSLAISLATDFPCHFSFGVGTSAYQSEGATDVDGRGPSIWDVFPPAADGSTADNATNFYHLYPEDIQNMKEMGVDRFRFSISWSRILPQGTRDKGVNQAGINHYNNLINSLINAGIEPVVTLYHWDLPQALQERFGGWLDKDKISMAFVDYADICFRKFGDRVKTWLTLNEPWATALVAYSYGLYAPGVSGDNFYKVSHNQLVAHAKVAAWYRSHYRHQQGKISIVLNSDFYEPLDVNNPEDVAATERYQLLTLGLFADPLYFGDYPQLLKSMVGDRLPRFTPLEKRLIRNSVDFLGFNHYTSRIVANINATETQCSPGPFQTNADVQVRYCNGRNGVRIGPSSDTSYFNVYPPGIKGIVKWIAHRYNNPEIRIYENGVDAPNEAELPKEEALVDTFRVNYLRDYLSQLAEAVTVDAVNVTQYSVWSLNDSWEWIAGFQSKFGLHHVDFSDPSLPRTVKSSGTWYREFIRSHKNRCDT